MVTGLKVKKTFNSIGLVTANLANDAIYDKLCSFSNPSGECVIYLCLRSEKKFKLDLP
jgi:hypothetical protein